MHNKTVSTASKHWTKTARNCCVVSFLQRCINSDCDSQYKRETWECLSIHFGVSITFADLRS